MASNGGIADSTVPDDYGYSDYQPGSGFGIDPIRGDLKTRPQPVEGGLWAYDTPAGAQIRVRYWDGHWESSATDRGPWERNDRIPEWPGMFTNLFVRRELTTRADVQRTRQEILATLAS